MTFYFDDDEAQEDFEPEVHEVNQQDLDEIAFNDEHPPKRFYLDVEEVVGPLPVIRDRLENDNVVARFVTLAAADRYMALREAGFNHEAALLRSGEV